MISLQQYRSEVQQELIENILPFYIDHAMDHTQGGFYGYIANNRTVQPDAPKGQVQHSRLLWSFAHAYRQLQNSTYRRIADYAYAYLRHHFWDNEQGGLYWMVDAQGRPLQTRKLVYGQAFGIYSLAEYYLATGDKESLETAVSLYYLLEQYSADTNEGGYFESHNQDWTLRYGENVDEIAAPVSKTMNTHLHVLEAYTNLLRAWPHMDLQKSLQSLIRSTIDHIIDTDSGHFKLHFKQNWESLHQLISYGHDIEGSWLLVEAATVLGKPDLLHEAKSISLHMAQTAYNEGLDRDGGLFSDSHKSQKEWWPQAEAMIGFFNAYQLCGKPHFLEACYSSWHFIRTHIIDHQHGEWFWGVDHNGLPLNKEKASPWKTPYHNGRACLEIMQRIDAL